MLKLLLICATIIVCVAFICGTIIKLIENRKFSNASFRCLNNLVSQLNDIFPGSTLNVEVMENNDILVHGELKYFKNNDNPSAESSDKVES